MNSTLKSVVPLAMFNFQVSNGDEEDSAVEVVTKSVELVEEENPDCVILVYAVDDRATFGETDKNILI